MPRVGPDFNVNNLRGLVTTIYTENLTTYRETVKNLNQSKLKKFVK